MEDVKSFDAWGIVEIMGHDRIAGRITEQAVGGCAFVRVDVPAVNGRDAYTRLFGPGAIFSVSVTSEDTAKMAATQFRSSPMAEWDARRLIQSQPQTRESFEEERGALKLSEEQRKEFIQGSWEVDPGDPDDIPI